MKCSRTTRALATVLVAATALTTAATATAHAAPAATKAHAGPAGKKLHASLHPGDSRTQVTVKFAEGSDVRLRSGRLVSAAKGRIPALDAVLARFPGTTATRLLGSLSEGQLAADHAAAAKRSGQPLADPNLYFSLHLKPKTDVVGLLDALNALSLVEVAAPATLPAAPPTADLSGRQGYRNPASSGGIDADFARTLAGGTGSNVTITDVEYAWNGQHEDLSKAAYSLVAQGTPCSSYPDHGTAVLGELVGDDNGYGVTGLVPGARLQTVNVSFQYGSGCASNIANAITLAASRSQAGDVILVEQHIPGPNSTNDPKSQYGFVPVEWDQSGATWNAIRSATDRGIVVVEPAGNGYQNLDSAQYNDSTGRNWFSYDSGAIMVGAGNAPGCNANVATRGRLDFSDYGSRVNVQGWGDCVTTTGYGDLQKSTNGSADYTAVFSGTSSASPIVTAAAAIVSSVAKAGGSTMTPAAIRSLLRSTGTAQPAGDAGQIGPLPNLRAALGGSSGSSGSAPAIAERYHYVYGSNLGTTTVPIVQYWSTTSGTAAQYDVWLKTDSAAYARVATTTSSGTVFQLERGHTYRFAARAAGSDGTWSGWAYGAAFSIGEYQENYSGDPTYSGSWTQAAWSPASDGAVKVSRTAGSQATFSFTGNNVAWVATKAASRGQANVYVDGTFVKTVNLYAASTSARAVVFGYRWSTVGQHRVTIRVVGTAGHPGVDVDAFVRLR